MTEGWTFGGIQLVNRMLIDSFLASDKVEELFVLSLNDSLDRIEMRNDDRIRYVGLGGRRSSIPASLPLTMTFDLVFASHIAMTSLGWLLCRRSTRFISTLYGIECWKKVSWLKRRALNRCQKLLSISDHTTNRFRSANPELSSLHVEHWPLAIDNPPFAGRKLTLGDGSVLLIGRMEATERYKGHDQLLEIWPRIKQQFPMSKLCFAGNGNDIQRLKDKAQFLGVLDSVIFHTGLTNEELAKLLQAASVFAMPSTGEGFGLVFLEAMAAGLPCIACKADAAREIVRDGDTGILVDADNSESLEQAVVTLLNDQNLALSMGQAGYDRWSKYFRYDAFRERTLHACGIAE